MRRMWFVVAVAGLFLAASCKEKSEPAPAAQQKEVKKDQPPAPQNPKAEEPKPEAQDPKPGETKPEAKPVEQKPAEAQVEKKPEQPAQKSPAEELQAIETVASAAGLDSVKMVDSLKALQEWQNKNPQAPEAAKAKVLSAKLRVSGLLMGCSGKIVDMDEKIMSYDGKLAADAQATPELWSQYMRGLAADMQKQAAELQGAEKDALMGYASLLAWQADDILESAGKVSGAKLEMPKEWLSSEKPIPAVEEVDHEEEVKSDAAGAAQAEQPKAEEPKAEEPKAEEPKAEEPKAEEPKAEEPKAEQAAVVFPATVAMIGADPNTLFALAAADSPVALEARYLMLLKMRDALKVGSAATEMDRWFEIADGMGKLLCAACGQFRFVRPEFRRQVVYSPSNVGIVCPEAKAAMETGTPAVEVVGPKCHSLFGIPAEEAALLTPVNALVMRIHALVLEKSAATEGAGFMVEELNALAAETRSLLRANVALFPPLRGFPKDKWEAMKDSLVLRSDLKPTSPAFSYMPLDVVVTDETSVSSLLRPVAQADQLPMAFIEKATGFGWPGKNVGNLEAIKAEVAEKEKGLKEKKVPYLDFFNAYVEDVVVKGVKFDKPDYSVPSLVTAAKELASAAETLEGGAYQLLKEKKVINSERATWENFADTVGKALLYAVDHKAPVLLMKKVLDSWYHADFKDMRLVKATGCGSTVPTVYYTEKYLDESVLDTTYKRPVLVYVTSDNQINFYPPATSSSRSKMTAKRSPNKRNSKWPGKFRSIYDPRNPDDIWNLFMSYTSEGEKDFEEKVAGIARTMQRKWDNGNVFYLMAHEKADAGLVVKVADILTHLPGSPVKDLAKAFPGYECDEKAGPEYCPTNIVVLFPEVEIPYLPGKVKVQEVQQNVHCDEKEINRRIMAKRGAIKFCYDPELQKNGNLKGRVVYKFTIGAAGRVTEISVENDGLGNKNVVDCALKVIRGVQFPRPIGGECKIRYPYNFKPE